MKHKYLYIISALILTLSSCQVTSSVTSSSVQSSISSTQSSKEETSAITYYGAGFPGVYTHLTSAEIEQGAQFPSYFTNAQKEYYAGVEGLKGTALKNKLHDIISSGTSMKTYSQDSQLLKEVDKDLDNSDNVIEIYTQRSVKAADRLGETTGSQLWNKEHVYPQSRGGFNTSNPGIGTDLHSLHCSDKNVNGKRENLNYYQFSEGETYYTDIKTAEGYSDDSKYNNSLGFEPIDNAKGDCARSVLYMAVMYPTNCSITNNTNQSTSSELGLLKYVYEWNVKDVVNEREMYRNYTVQKYQKNRNPFIDCPNWVDLIWSADGLIA